MRLRAPARCSPPLTRWASRLSGRGAATRLPIVLVLGATLFSPAALLGQAAPPTRDTTASQGTAARDAATRLAPVRIQGASTPAGLVAPQSVVSAPVLRQQATGAELPVALRQQPGVSFSADAGTGFGYTYLRVRGFDQTRLAATLEGLPISEPEDQGFFSSNLPNLSGVLGSAQLINGVGGSMGGAAAIAGQLNLSLRPLVDGRGIGRLDQTLGAFGLRQTQLQLQTRLRPGNWAGWVSVTDQAADGFRERAAHQGRQVAAGGGWIGAQTQVSGAVVLGDVRHEMSWLATPWETARVAPRTNLLPAGQTEHFQQGVALVKVEHQRASGSAWRLVLMQNELDGHYDVSGATADETLNLRLRHSWTQAALSWASAPASVLGADEAGRRAGRFEAGVLGSTFARDHQLRRRPDLSAALYANTGHRDEATLWARRDQPLGARWDAAAELQVRHTMFGYTPDAADAQAGVVWPTQRWTFVNPRLRVGRPLGVTQTYRVDLIAAQTTREPTRGDLFGGADNLDAPQLAALTARGLVQPEQLQMLELRLQQIGASPASPTAAARPRRDGAGASRRDQAPIALQSTRVPGWSLALHAGQLRNEIAAAGPLAPTGLPLRRNVAQSTRGGVEGTWAVALGDATGLRVTGSWLHARFGTWVEETTGDTVRQARPILTPTLQGALMVERRLGAQTRVLLEGFAQSGTVVSPLGRASDRLPALAWADLTVARQQGPLEPSLVMRNLGDQFLPMTGWPDAAPRPAVFPLAGRHVLARASLPLGAGR